MADATIITNQSAVVQEMVRRCNSLLGFPKVGLAANGATALPGQIQMPETSIVSTSATEVTAVPANGNTYLHVTDTFRNTINTVVAAANARITNGTAISFDQELVALTESAYAVADVPQTIFNPLQISGAGAWLRADTGVTSAASAVSQWMAYTTSQGAPFGQATASAKPTLTAAASAGRSAITFGVDDFMTNGQAEIRQPGTIYIVAKPANVVGTKVLLISADGNFRVQYVNANVEVYAGSTISVGPTTAVVSLIEIVLEGNNSLVGINGSGPNFVSLGANNGLGGLRVGSDNAGANFFTGDMFEMIYFARTLNAEERKTVRYALGDQYALKVQ